MSRKRGAMFCVQCGTKSVPNAKFCANCGAPLIRPQDLSTQHQAQMQNSSSSQPASRTYHSNMGLSGVGGWLMFLVASMVIIGPILGSMVLKGSFLSVERQHANITLTSEWRTYKSLMWGLWLLLVGINIFGGWGLLTGRTWSVVTRAKWILWITALGAPILVMLITFVAFDSTAIDKASIPAILMVKTIPSTIWATSWTAYLSRSKRVRNTYGEDTVTARPRRTDGEYLLCPACNFEQWEGYRTCQKCGASLN